MTSLLSSESFDDLTSLILIAIRNSSQPATGYANGPRCALQPPWSLYQRRPALMTSIPDQHWFCQFSNYLPGHRGIPADTRPNQLLPLTARDSTIWGIRHFGRT